MPGAESPRVSVVVCTYSGERRSTLLESIQSLRAQTSPAHEVIVAVDHNPGLLDWIREHAPDVIAVANEGEHGLASTRNAGAWAASGEVVAFVDDDARAAPDWIERLRLAYRDGDVIGAGGAVLPEFEGARPRWLPEEFDWVVGCSYRGLPSSPAPVRNLIGCNMSFRRDVLLSAGGFSHGLGRVDANRVGCEETELCIRMQGRHPEGWFLYDPEARVRHHVPRTRARLSYFLSRCHAEGVSKAEVARRCGLSGALESERTYTRTTVPAGIRDGLLAFGAGDAAGLARAGTMVLGVIAAAGGFVLPSRPRAVGR